MSEPLKYELHLLMEQQEEIKAKIEAKELQIHHLQVESRIVDASAWLETHKGHLFYPRMLDHGMLVPFAVEVNTGYIRCYNIYGYDIRQSVCIKTYPHEDIDIRGANLNEEQMNILRNWMKSVDMYADAVKCIRLGGLT